MDAVSLVVGAILPFIGQYIGREWKKQDQERQKVDKAEERLLKALGEFVSSMGDFLDRANSIAHLERKVDAGVAKGLVDAKWKTDLNDGWAEFWSTRAIAKAKAMGLMFLITEEATRSEIRAIIMTSPARKSTEEMLDDVRDRSLRLEALVEKLAGKFAPPVPRGAEREHLPNLPMLRARTDDDEP